MENRDLLKVFISGTSVAFLTLLLSACANMAYLEVEYKERSTLERGDEVVEDIVSNITSKIYENLAENCLLIGNRVQIEVSGDDVSLELEMVLGNPLDNSRTDFAFLSNIAVSGIVARSRKSSKNIPAVNMDITEDCLGVVRDNLVDAAYHLRNLNPVSKNKKGSQTARLSTPIKFRDSFLENAVVNHRELLSKVFVNAICKSMSCDGLSMKATFFDRNNSPYRYHFTCCETRTTKPVTVVGKGYPKTPVVPEGDSKTTDRVVCKGCSRTPVVPEDNSQTTAKVEGANDTQTKVVIVGYVSDLNPVTDNLAFRVYPYATTYVSELGFPWTVIPEGENYTTLNSRKSDVEEVVEDEPKETRKTKEATVEDEPEETGEADESFLCRKMGIWC